jgi:LysM repeat protein
MKKSSSAPARIAAVTALALAAVIVLVALGSSLGGGDSGSGRHHHHGGTGHRAAAKHEHVPATYEVQSGDTLISIAHKTGVPVREIEALNPEVDPQILIAGEELKLRESR